MGPCTDFLNTGPGYVVSSWHGLLLCVLLLVGVAILFVGAFRSSKDALFPLYLGFLLLTSYTQVLEAVWVRRGQTHAHTRTHTHLHLFSLLSLFSLKPTTSRSSSAKVWWIIIPGRLFVVG